MLCRKILALILAFSSCWLVAGCGGSGSQDPPASEFGRQGPDPRYEGPGDYDPYLRGRELPDPRADFGGPPRDLRDAVRYRDAVPAGPPFPPRAASRPKYDFDGISSGDVPEGVPRAARDILQDDPSFDGMERSDPSGERDATRGPAAPAEDGRSGDDRYDSPRDDTLLVDDEPSERRRPLSTARLQASTESPEDSGREEAASPTKATTPTQGDRIVETANRYVGMRTFKYHPATKGGRLGCAQVVTAILKDAGALDRTSLGVSRSMSMLREKGWKAVKPPPWRNGDVLTWATVDKNGDGKRDPDTHIGIIEVVDGVPFAICNSSKRLRPVKFALANYPARVSNVLRNSAS